MNSIMGNGPYVDQSSSQRALSPEDIAPSALEHSAYHSDVASLEDQLAQGQGLHSLHVQQPARLSQEISLSSDIAQNTCLPGGGVPERKSLGEDSVNDYAVKPDETMDDILRFFLKVNSLQSTGLPVCKTSFAVWQSASFLKVTSLCAVLICL